MVRGVESLCWFSYLSLAHLTPAHPAYIHYGRGHIQIIYSVCFLTAHSLSIQLLFHTTRPCPYPSDPSSAWSWSLPLWAIQSSSAKTHKRFATSSRFVGSFCPTGSALHSVSQQQEDTGYSHTSTPSTVNWKCKLEAIVLNTGMHVTLTYVPPTTLFIHDFCPSPLISPMLSHFHHQCPSQTRLRKHHLQSLSKIHLSAYGGREGWEIEMRS